jgi:hypothetical protein
VTAAFLAALALALLVGSGPVTGTPVIDGMTITAGRADGGPDHKDGGELYCAGGGNDVPDTDAECSSALANVTFSGASSPALTNVTFGSNSAGSGGAMFNLNVFGGDTSPTLTNVILWGNSASARGDQMYDDHATPAI